MRRLYAHKYRLGALGATKITNEFQQNIYLVVGKWGRHQDVLSVYAISGELLAEIKQRGFGIFPRFELFSHQQHVGTLRRYHLGRKDVLLVKKLNWIILGDFSTYRYNIYSGKEHLMSLREVALPRGDYLELAVKNTEDEALCLCIVAILDYFAHSAHRKKNPFLIPRAKFD
ncbi:LURP-one-related/scramblase family protein [Liquorilactobacillus satsumensis]|uniref:YxjI n=1 Tax=Liquorilactobacillus satsumensis DSM 16230 = JCM 12392 TaxID=1423801 RepID=A0A0R1V9N0_9LACO|nr:hypothetical protein [Liquorilactobacillus satsumensis]KRL99730.1 hypothetical protein FD50_GL000048 [Liquorilactobacillus satsumensis DSM 16230 = JCM 12392]MCC7665734.1 hypothetical protein [Liquorilactobacillus satsumensis]MCP9313458.1 hypothetical protein [Liquorilactobacillus satsumensis]MCP9328253.1 hypothetical protein [Liquorilactobacillus satsumensis]MCP9356472.1 hypothetical protein [Liquorilactobacillus satsumensis]